MKKILFVVLATGVMVGCSTSHYGSKSELFVEKRAQPMSRQQVIQAIQDCEVSRMRPIMIMAKRRVNDWDTDIVIDVTCAPKNPSQYHF